MCGIIGYTGDRAATPLIMNGLHELEYRGYDSAGIAVLNDEVMLQKTVGSVDALANQVQTEQAGRTGIGHTRWATHGGVTEANAHPHTDCTGQVTIVHNGILENYEELKDELGDHDFASETDTEVIAHFLSGQLSDGKDMAAALQQFLDRAKGTLAVVAMDDTGALYGVKRGSPLVVGVADDGCFIASDVHAFGEHTRDVIVLEDEEIVAIDDDPTIFDATLEPVDREPETISDAVIGDGKNGYDHYMLKEIHEQPTGLRRVQESLANAQADAVQDFLDLVQEKDKLLFTAAGTSYHASLLGVFYLQKAGIEAQTLISSEFEHYERVDEDTLLVAVSQSGETRDTLDAIEYSREQGAAVASIVNMPHSAISRESDVSLEIHAGKETAVAATKSFSNTVYTLLHLAQQLGYDADVTGLPDQLEQMIADNTDTITDLAHTLAAEDDMYVIGRGATYPIAREIALKLKEVPYIHAEGMMGGELKHGTLALIEDGTPVIALIPDQDDHIMSNVHEIEARGGRVIRVSPGDADITVPGNGDLFPFFATTFGFLFAYELGKERGCPIDKPRNLAKTVTVR